MVKKKLVVTFLVKAHSSETLKAEFALEQVILQVILVQRKLMDQFSLTAYMNMTKITS